MALIPEMVIEDFNILSTNEKRNMLCTEIVTKNGDYIGTWICPVNLAGIDIVIRTNAEYLGVRSNSVYQPPEPEPEEPEEIYNPLACDYCGKFCKTTAGRMAHERACEHNSEI